MKKCEHHHLDIKEDGFGRLAMIECLDCKLTWKYNKLFYYWSDSYVTKKKFNNPKDALNYLKNKAKKGEAIILDERATEIRPRRINKFVKNEDYLMCPKCHVNKRFCECVKEDSGIKHE